MSSSVVRKPISVTTVVLRFIGKITIGVGDVLLRDSVHQALADGYRDIILDMSEMSTIDSSGVGELVSAFTSITSRGGRIKLAGLPPKLEDILQVTQFISVFDVYPDVDEALAAVKRGD